MTGCEDSHPHQHHRHHQQQRHHHPNLKHRPPHRTMIRKSHPIHPTPAINSPPNRFPIIPPSRTTTAFIPLTMTFDRPRPPPKICVHLRPSAVNHSFSNCPTRTPLPRFTAIFHQLISPYPTSLLRLPVAHSEQNKNLPAAFIGLFSNSVARNADFLSNSRNTPGDIGGPTYVHRITGSGQRIQPPSSQHSAPSTQHSTKKGGDFPIPPGRFQGDQRVNREALRGRFPFHSKFTTTSNTTTYQFPPFSKAFFFARPPSRRLTPHQMHGIGLSPRSSSIASSLVRNCKTNRLPQIANCKCLPNITFLCPTLSPPSPTPPATSAHTAASMSPKPSLPP